VCHRATPAVFHREARLGTIQGLDLTFLIYAEDKRMLGWVQIHPHHILHFLLEVRIATELEEADPVRFEAVRLPHALYQHGIGPQMPDY
jgi:hypothetical protein